MPLTQNRPQHRCPAPSRHRQNSLDLRWIEAAQDRCALDRSAERGFAEEPSEIDDGAGWTRTRNPVAMAYFRSAGKRHVMAPYAVDLPSRRVGRGHFNRNRQPISKAEEVRGGEMRDDGSRTAGQYRRHHSSAIVVHRVADAKGSSKGWVEMSAQNGLFDRAVGEPNFSQLAA
jgi:hypothetical protein